MDGFKTVEEPVCVSTKPWLVLLCHAKPNAYSRCPLARESWTEMRPEIISVA